MSVLNILKDLYNHMHWADEKIWKTTLSIPDAQEHEKLKEILHHYHITKYAFYDIWMERPLEFPKLEGFETLQDLADWAAEYPVKVNSYLANLKDEDLERVITVPWAKHLEKVLGQKPVDATLAETILQVPVHSSHHRGQVNAIIRSLGVEPPLVDYIAWAWLGKPIADIP
jgi:uncharacterized damage-inducible protein DinB